MYKQKQMILTTTGCVDGRQVSEYLELATKTFITRCEKQRDVSKTVDELAEEAKDWLESFARRKSADAVLGVQFLSDVALIMDDDYEYGFLVTAQISGTPVQLEAES